MEPDPSARFLYSIWGEEEEGKKEGEGENRNRDPYFRGESICPQKKRKERKERTSGSVKFRMEMFLALSRNEEGKKRRGGREKREGVRRNRYSKNNQKLIFVSISLKKKKKGEKGDYSGNTDSRITHRNSIPLRGEERRKCRRRPSPS